MRNRTIRMKRLREQRRLEDYLRTPRGIITGFHPIRPAGGVDFWAIGPGRLWAMPNA